MLTSYVRIVKKDAETGNLIPVSGIGFKVWDCKNSRYVEQKINYPTEMILDVFYTDESGTLTLPNELVYGDYELHEVQTAEGYFLGSEAVPFTVDGKEEVITVEKFNKAQKGKISVQKTGDIFAGVNIASSAYADENGNAIENLTTYTPVFSDGKLSGAVFQVIAGEDIITADGTVRANAGDIVAEIATDENGYAETDPLYLGKYEIKEVQTVSIDCGTFENRLKRGKIEGIKTNESGDPLENALFGLFAMDCTEFTEENALMTAKSDDKGCFSFADIPFGEYVIRELSAPDGYILSEESYPVTVSENDEIIRIEIENKPVTVEISKRDADGNELKGVQMQLLDDKGTVVDEWTSDGTNHIVAKLSAGKYILKETAAPEGYTLATDICFEVLNDGTVTVDGAETTAVSENGNPLIVMIDEAEQKEIPQDTPHTGDSRSNTAAWLMIAGGLSGLCALLVSCKIRKRKELERIRTEEIRKASECPDFIDKD